MCSRAPVTVIHLPVSGRGSSAVQNAAGAGEIAAGERFGASHDLRRSAFRDDVAAETAGAGAEVENVVGVADGVFVVLDDEDGVAEIAQAHESFDEAGVVALVQADGGLVEHVEHAAEARADLRGETDALAFSAGERGGVAVEREIVEADGAEEFEALDDFAADAFGNEGFARGEVELDGGGERAVERQRSEVGDGEAADFDGEGLGTQALAAAGGAGRGGHEVHHVLAIAVAARFVDGVAQIGEDAVEAGARGFALGRTVDQDVLLLGRQVFEGLLQIDVVAVGGEVDELEQVLRGGAGAEAAVEQRLGPVGDDLGRVEIVERAEAMALGAGAEGGVEGEAARLELGDVEAAIGAGHGGGEELFFAVGEPDENEAVGQLQSLGDGGFEAFFDGGLVAGRLSRGDASFLAFPGLRIQTWGTRLCGRRSIRSVGGLQQDAVDDGFDGVVLALVESGRLGEVHDLAVDARAKALLIKLVEQVLELALAASDDGRHDGDALAGAELQNALDDLVGGLAGDGPAAVGAVGRADRGVEQAQVVVDLGDGADGGAGAAAGGLLLDGDGRTEALDGVDVGALDLVEELARIGGERLDVAALALGVDGVEGERALAGAGEAGDHRERVAGDAHVDVAQVMLARPAHRDVSDGHMVRRLGDGGSHSSGLDLPPKTPVNFRCGCRELSL